MKLVLVRHGQTSSNRSGALDTLRPGAPLDVDGLDQARSLAQRWEGAVGAPPSAIMVSPLKRTRQTAQPLVERYSLTPSIRQGIRELRAGSLEMNPDPLSVITYMQSMAAWANGVLDVRMPGAETGFDVLARALPVVNEALAVAEERDGAHGVAVLIAHGAIIRVLTATLCDNVPGDLVVVHPMGNANTTIIDTRGHSATRNAFHAVTWNEQPVEDLEVPNEVGWPIPSRLHQSPPGPHNANG